MTCEKCQREVRLAESVKATAIDFDDPQSTGWRHYACPEKEETAE